MANDYFDQFQPEGDYFSQFDSAPEQNKIGKGLRGIGGELLAGTRGFNNALANIVGFGPHVQNARRKYEEAKQTNPNDAAIGNLAGNIVVGIPAWMSGEALAGLAPKIAQYGPRAIQMAGSMIGGGLTEGAKPVGQGESRLQNTIEGGLEAGVMDGIFGTVGEAFNYIRPSSFAARAAKGAIPERELLNNARVATGTETPIGDVTGSSFLKKAFENEVAPLSGEVADQSFARTNQHLAGTAHRLVSNLGKGAPSGDLNYGIEGILKDASKRQTKLKNKLYNDVTQIEFAENFDLKLPKFKRLANKTVKEIQDSPLLQHDSDAKKLFNKVRGYRNLDKNKPIAIKDANILASKFSSAADSARASPIAAERHLAGKYAKFARSLRSDVKAQVESKGSNSLKESLAAANENYKKNFLGFLDKDIYKLTNGSKDAETLVNDVIRPGNVDRFRRIEKVQALLPENKRSLLGFEYLNRAVDESGNINPSKMAAQIKKLGKRQIKALFPDKQVRDEILDFKKLADMNTEATSRLFNAKTGQRNVGSLQQGIKSGLATAGGIAGTLSGGPVMGALGGLAAYQAPKIGAKYLSKLATSEKFRNKVIEEILNNGTKSTKEAFASPKDIMKAALKRGLSPSSYED